MINLYTEIVIQDTTLVVEELFKSKSWLQNHQLLGREQFCRQRVVEIADLHGFPQRKSFKSQSLHSFQWLIPAWAKTTTSCWDSSWL